MMENNKSINNAVLETLVYYRALGTPLTLVQIARYMISPKPIFGFSLSQVNNALLYWQKRNVLERQRGLYWLRKRRPTSEVQELQSEVCSLKSDSTWLRFIQREKIAQKKLNIVRRTIKFIRFIPGLRGLFVCGSVARKVSSRKSDIDFFILTKENRTWTVRFFLTMYSLLVGRKTQDDKPRHNKFCLNHYRSSAKLKLEEQLQDLYSAQEYAQMVNVYSYAEIENKFFTKNKSWMGRYIPNFNFLKPAFKTSVVRRQTTEFRELQSEVCRLKSKLGDYLEKILRSIQQNQIKRSSQDFMGLDNRRIVTDNEVVMFHLNPRASAVIKRYKHILENISQTSYGN